jgi:hypothetical protein
MVSKQIKGFNMHLVKQTIYNPKNGLILADVGTIINRQLIRFLKANGIIVKVKKTLIKKVVIEYQFE